MFIYRRTKLFWFLLTNLISLLGIFLNVYIEIIKLKHMTIIFEFTAV